jgi:transcriptional regulator with XRE-family HTH domain
MDRVQRDRLFAQERLILDVTETICDQMEQRGLRRSDLADALGVSKAYVTQALRGDRNLTLRSLVDFASALECEVVIHLAPRAFDESRSILHEIVQVHARSAVPVSETQAMPESGGDRPYAV